MMTGAPLWRRSVIRPLGALLTQPAARQSALQATANLAASEVRLMPPARPGVSSRSTLGRDCGITASLGCIPRALTLGGDGDASLLVPRSRSQATSSVAPALGVPSLPSTAPALIAGHNFASSGSRLTSGCGLPIGRGLARGGAGSTRFGIGGVGTLSHSGRHFSTRNIRGRLFYKRRPKMIPIWKFNRKSKWLEGVGSRKGVCTKVYVMAPRKPNSGLRKVAYVRLSNGRIVKAYIPGIGHNLQVHSVVMVRGGAKKDTDGCNYTCMRGKYDLLPVKNRKSSRSKYGVTRPNRESRRSRFKGLTTQVDRRLYFYRTGQVADPDEEHVDQPIPYVVRSTPLFTYQHNSKKRPRAK